MRLGSTVIDDFKPHPKQLDLIRALFVQRRRFIGVAAGRGSGKSVMARRSLFVACCDSNPKPWSDPRYFYAAPTRDQAKRLAWDNLKDMIPRPWIIDGSESELWLDLSINGHPKSRIQLLGLDRPERTEGLQWDGGVVDESCDVKPKIIDRSILPALIHRQGWLLRIGVPKRQGVGAKEFRRFCLDAQAGKLESAAYFNWPSSEIVPPEKLAALRAVMDPKDYREQIEASWETAGGGIFYAFNSQENVRPCAYDPNKPLLIGADFNVDPMAWVCGHRHGDVLEWFDELWLRDTNTLAALDVLWGRYSNHKGGFFFFADASSGARKSSASLSDYKLILNDERLKKAGRKIVFPSIRPDGKLESNPPIKDRFSACNAMFLNAAGRRRMFIDPRCVRLIDDCEARYYKPGGVEPDDTGDLGHVTDALGYAVHCMFPIRLEIVEEPATIGAAAAVGY